MTEVFSVKVYPEKRRVGLLEALSAWTNLFVIRSRVFVQSSVEVEEAPVSAGPFSGIATHSTVFNLRARCQARPCGALSLLHVVGNVRGVQAALVKWVAEEAVRLGRTTSWLSSAAATATSAVLAGGAEAEVVPTFTSAKRR